MVVPRARIAQCFLKASNGLQLTVQFIQLGCQSVWVIHLVFAHGPNNRVMGRFKLTQSVGVGLFLLLQMQKGICQVLQFNAHAQQAPDHIIHFLVDALQLTQSAPRFLKVVQCAQFVSVTGVGRNPETLVKFMGVLQGAQFGVQSLPIEGMKTQGIQFVDLVLEVMHVARRCSCKHFQCIQLRFGVQPSAVGLEVRVFHGSVVARNIQNVRQRRSIKRDAHVVLFVKADEQTAQFSQLADCGLSVVDEHTRTAVSEHFSSNGNANGVRKVVLIQPS